MNGAFFFAVILAGYATLFAQIKHKFIMADEGGAKILLIDQFNPANNWAITSPGYHRDLQLIGNNRLLVSLETDGGYCELDLKNGAVLKKKTGLVKSGHGVTARRLPNGHTLFIGDNILTGLSGTTVVEFDSADKVIVRKFSYPKYSGMRLARRTPAGTFLFGTSTKVCEGDTTGTVIWEKTVPGAGTVYQAVRLANGNTLADNGWGKTLFEINSSGAVLKKYGGATQPGADSIVPNFYAGFQVLENKHIIITNWEGHGPGHGGTGIQVMEYDTSGKMVWHWKNAALISSLHHVLVIDSLDTKYLHDDRNGGVLLPEISTAINKQTGFLSSSAGFSADFKHISYAITEDSRVTIQLYTVQGRRVKTLRDCFQRQGLYEMSTGAGDLSHGYYIVDFKAGLLNEAIKISPR
jgi:hypothetical protein